MSFSIYLLYFVCFFNFLIGIYALARVGKFLKSVRDLDWEELAALIGDVASTKKAITRLNGKLNGMNNAAYDWKEEALRAMQTPTPQVKQGG